MGSVIIPAFVNGVISGAFVQAPNTSIAEAFGIPPGAINTITTYLSNAVTQTTHTIESLTSTDGNDNIFTTLHTTVNAGDGDDTILGDLYSQFASGRPIRSPDAVGSLLMGGAGNDLIEGSAAADILAGGTGNNTLTGGGGGDVYVVDASGNDLIVDLAPNWVAPGKYEDWWNNHREDYAAYSALFNQGAAQTDVVRIPVSFVEAALAWGTTVARYETDV